MEAHIQKERVQILGIHQWPRDLRMSRSRLIFSRPRNLSMFLRMNRKLFQLTVKIRRKSLMQSQTKLLKLRMFLYHDILSKVRKVASIIRLSDYYRTKKFKEFCQRCKIAFTMPPGEVVTRWNSTFELLIWFFRFRQPLSDYLNSVYSDASEGIENQLRELGSSALFGETASEGVDLAFSNKEWQEITLMRYIVEPLYNFTCIFNKSQSFCSDALNAFFFIEEFLKDTTEATTPVKVMICLNFMLYLATILSYLHL
jgi:hypothetical protein